MRWLGSLRDSSRKHNSGGRHRCLYVHLIDERGLDSGAVCGRRREEIHGPLLGVSQRFGHTSTDSVFSGRATKIVQGQLLRSTQTFHLRSGHGSG